MAAKVTGNGISPARGIAASVNAGRGSVPPVVDIVEGVVRPAEALPQDATGTTAIIEASKRQKLTVAAWRGYLHTGEENISSAPMRGFRDLHGG